jgi:chorismate synthase
MAKKIISPVHIQAQILELGGDNNLERAINNITDTGDSIGGIIQCTATNLPQGLGEPFFGGVESTISSLVFSIPAIKGIEFGLGFGATKIRGSQHNDAWISPEGKTQTNNAGGVNGGITNGNDLIFKVAVKPTSSISLPQQTINLKTGTIETLTVEGRHDACIALRVPVVLEAATAIGLADLFLLNKS